MNYIINQDFDKIDDENRTVLFTGTVENVYILNEIETQIWRLFDSPCSIYKAHEKFNAPPCQVKVEQEDFFEFVEQLIIRRILVLTND